MANNLYYKRTFLNKKEGTALVECRVRGDTFGTVKITDCNRSVTLEFNSYDEPKRDLMAYKIDKLISELTAFRDKLMKAPE